MGVNLNSQENHDQEYVQAAKDMCRIIMDRTFSLWKSFDCLFNLSKQGKSQEKVLAILHNFTNSVIDKRRKKATDQLKDVKQDDVGRKRKMAFLDLLLSTNIGGRPLTQEEIRSEVDTFMFAVSYFILFNSKKPSNYRDTILRHQLCHQLFTCWQKTQKFR